MDPGGVLAYAHRHAAVGTSSCLGLLKWRSKAGLRMFGQVMSMAIRPNPLDFR